MAQHDCKEHEGKGSSQLRLHCTTSLCTTSPCTTPQQTSEAQTETTGLH